MVTSDPVNCPITEFKLDSTIDASNNPFDITAIISFNTVTGVITFNNLSGQSLASSISTFETYIGIKFLFTAKTGYNSLAATHLVTANVVID